MFCIQVCLQLTRYISFQTTGTVGRTHGLHLYSLLFLSIRIIPEPMVTVLLKALEFNRVHSPAGSRWCGIGIDERWSAARVGVFDV